MRGVREGKGYIYIYIIKIRKKWSTPCEGGAVQIKQDPKWSKGGRDETKESLRGGRVERRERKEGVDGVEGGYQQVLGNG